MQTHLGRLVTTLALALTAAACDPDDDDGLVDASDAPEVDAGVIDGPPIDGSPDAPIDAPVDAPPDA